MTGTERRRPRRGWGKIRRLPSGRYQASYVGPDLTRHPAPITFTTRMDSEAWLADERQRIERRQWTPPAQREAEKWARTETLDEYAERWIAQRTLKPRTRQIYNDIMRLHISPKLGRVPVGNLTGQAVRTWYAGLGTEHPRRNSHAYSLLHAVLGTAVKDQLLQVNPCQIERAMNSKRKTAPDVLTIAELATVADTIRPESMKALVLLSAWCGVRWGEVTELRRGDISAGCEVLHVRRAVTHRNGCHIDTPKTGTGRTVVIPPHIRPDIEHHLATYVAKDVDALLFSAQNSCHLTDRTFRPYLDKAVTALGRNGIRIHSLRHFAGTQAARVGNLVETMSRLGHTTVSASLLYTHVVSGRDAEIAAALSALATGTVADHP